MINRIISRITNSSWSEGFVWGFVGGLTTCVLLGAAILWVNR